MCEFIEYIYVVNTEINMIYEYQCMYVYVYIVNTEINAT